MVGALLLVLAVAGGVGLGLLVERLADGEERTVARPADDGPRPGPPVATPAPGRIGPPTDVLDARDGLRLDGLGPVRLGMTLAQAATAAGVALVEDGGCAVPAGGEPPVRFLLDQGRIAGVEVPDGSRVRTLSGVGLGSAVDEVRRVYGRRVTPVAGGLRYTVDDPRYAVQFATAGDEVVGLRAGLVAALDGPGCRS